MPTTEERLAALEKQMAAWMDQRPTTYYTHQYSGEEIDAAVGRALTGGALDTSVTNVSNQLGTFVRPNLLDNWYFGRPVNQRGQTEYKGDWMYSFDRWKISPSSIVSVSGGGLSVIADFQQAILSTALILGQKYTMSVLSTDGRLGQLTFTLQQDIAINQGFGFGYFVIYRDDYQYWFRLYGSNEATYLAIKLELGATQTLAHREGDRWVINEVPEYGEQLRRCQGYCVDVAPPVIFNTMYSGFLTTTGCELLVPIPVTLRDSAAAPVVICNPSEWQVAVVAANKYFTPTSIIVAQFASGAVVLRCLFSHSLPAQYCDLRKAVDSAKLILSKDL